MKVTGLVSVMPYAINMPLIPNSASSMFMTAGLTDEPAARPVLTVDIRYRFDLFASTSAMNMVGTPSSAVHFSLCSASRTSGASNWSHGNTMVLPWVKVPRNPITRPKQWKSGGGQQTMSEGVNCIASPTKRPLLIRFLEDSSAPSFRNQGHADTDLCESMAALGAPVVPVIVNMLLVGLAKLAYRM